MVKNQPAMQERQETQVQSLGREDPLEEEMATHSRICAWEIIYSFVAAPESWLLHVVNCGYFSLWCMGFSFQWLFLLWSMGSRASGLQ